MVPKTLLSCEEFERLAPKFGPCELLDGEVVSLSPGGFKHSRTTLRIGFLLEQFVRSRQLGRILTNEAGFHVQRDPPRTRGADIAFISYRRLPQEEEPTGFLTIPPELIVEVFGHESTWAQMAEKITDYHRFGVEMVWVADPEAYVVKTFPRGGVAEVVHEAHEIDGGAVLPGFRMPVARFFREE